MDSGVEALVEEYINALELQPHPEGGYYARTYESPTWISKTALPDGFSGDRPFATAIYFLLKGNQYSAFHRIKSDELWHHYAGCGLCIYVIHPNGKGEIMLLGKEIKAGFRFQHRVPAGCWFASRPVDSTQFSLCGCTVSPGFDFDDFEMGDKHKLITRFPEHQSWIEEMTSGD
ncbi:MAG: cupin domain-containing protein [Bacteroidetes bacterium]|nr:cupin domain-containing protein [Bacteroidota bacterium]